MIPKVNGKLRRLGIPTVADRVVQASLKLVLEPVFEAYFLPYPYGFSARTAPSSSRAAAGRGGAKELKGWGIRVRLGWVGSRQEPSARRPM